MLTHLILITAHRFCAELAFELKHVAPKPIALHHHASLLSFPELLGNLGDCSFQVMPIPHLVYLNSSIPQPME